MDGLFLLFVFVPVFFFTVLFAAGFFVADFFPATTFLVVTFFPVVFVDGAILAVLVGPALLATVRDLPMLLEVDRGCR